MKTYIIQFLHGGIWYFEGVQQNSTKWIDYTTMYATEKQVYTYIEKMTKQTGKLFRAIEMP